MDKLAKCYDMQYITSCTLTCGLQYLRGEWKWMWLDLLFLRVMTSHRGLSRATYLLKVSRRAAEPNEEES
eukprot:scaffold86976_cov48-Phaeocystis_antarctica.AAC.1